VNILFGGDSYSPSKHICKSYGINSELLKDNLIRVSYKSHVGHGKQIESKAWDVLQKVTLDIGKYKNIEEYLKSITPKIRLYIKGRINQFKNGSLEYFTNGKFITYKKSENKSTKEHYSEFVERKLAETLKSNQNSIYKLQNGLYSFPRRNFTNNRLNHIITNFPSRFHKLLRLDKEQIVEIDMKNSQFAIFSNLISKPLNDMYTCLLSNIVETTVYYCM